MLRLAISRATCSSRASIPASSAIKATIASRWSRNNGTVATSETVDWQALGLKYDPAALPIEQELDPKVRRYTEEEYAMTLIHGRSVNPPHFHPRTSDIPVANIHFRSHHPALLSTFTHFAAHAASSLGIPTSRVIPLPTQRTLWTVLRSPFAHKKSQENFDRKVHKRAIKAWDADAEVVERWIAYLRKHAMPGVGMKVTTWNRVPLGMGSCKLVMEAPTVHNAALESGNKIKLVAEDIVRKHTKAAESGAEVKAEEVVAKADEVVVKAEEMAVKTEEKVEQKAEEVVAKAEKVEQQVEEKVAKVEEKVEAKAEEKVEAKAEEKVEEKVEAKAEEKVEKA